MASWDEYAVKKTLEHDRQIAKEQGRKEGRKEGHKVGREEGREEGGEKGREEGIEVGIEVGAEKKSYEVVKNLLLANKFTFSDISNFANVNETFVRKVKKEL